MSCFGDMSNYAETGASLLNGGEAHSLPSHLARCECQERPNERMQLTWLLGAPSQCRSRFTGESSGNSVSVHPPRS